MADIQDPLPDPTPLPAPPAPLPDGTVVVYALEDSGRDFVHLGIFLEPGVENVVGSGEGADIPSDFAALLVDRGICVIKPAAAPVAATPARPVAPAPAAVPAAPPVTPPAAPAPVAPAAPAPATPAVA